MSTDKNLAAAFAGESQANQKYLAFAKQADAEGYTQIAKLFRATAAAEILHAYAELKTMGGIKTTAENLKTAIHGETYEFTEMYPEFIKEAEGENQTAALRVFRLANEAEKVHAALYQKALDNLDSTKATDYYLCTVCGHIAEDSAPEKCPICGGKSQVYKKVD
jgi:rubrerythrin